jgi:hypothetical protein
MEHHGKKTLLAVLLLFAASALFRMPTLFNDFYDVDELAAIVQTWEYMAGDIPGRDFAESKLPLYHAIFKFSYAVSPLHGWVVVHAITIGIVFLTALFIFLIGRRLRDFRTGAIAGLFYAVMISSFNSQFMATNGEIVFNLPLSAGLYFFLRFLSGEGIARYLHLALAAAMGIAASAVKFHGLILFIFIGFFLVVCYPYFFGRFTRRYAVLLASLASLAAAFFIADYFFTMRYAPRLASEFSGKLFYAAAKGLNPLVFIAKFVHRQGLLAVWHFALWAPAAVYLWRFIKKKGRTSGIEESAVAVYFIFAYLMAFAGGSRLYYHYFMIAYPALSIVAAVALSDLNVKAVAFARRKLAALVLVPGLFFLAWNTKDVVIKHFYPAGFYNEGKVLYWARAALVGTFNHYLLPEASYLDACNFIRSVTAPSDRIFVWGDGPYLYYFTGRRLGTKHMWPKTRVIRARGLYARGDAESLGAARSIEQEILGWIASKRPALFIDTSPNGLSGFTFPPTPMVADYIREQYHFLAEVSGMRIYALNGFAPRR